jgi:alkanesulfonate monooxygenase SsuD/methylene tetrahydromethanopterin reductase-like flavin-dependent oxidoreductase (luciferase family)
VVDGVILNVAPVEHLAELTRAAREAVADAGRDPASLTVTALVHTVFGSDRSAPGLARKSAELVASYGRQRYYRSTLAAAGFEQEAAALEAAHARGDDEAALRAVSDRLLDEVVVSDRLPECVARLRRAGVDVPTLYPYAVAMSWTECFSAAIDAVGTLGSAPGN